MFHAARALLYYKKLREDSHYCLILALRELYVKTKQIDATHLEAIKEAKSLREAADYHSEWSEPACRRIIEKAGDLIANVGDVIAVH